MMLNISQHSLCPEGALQGWIPTLDCVWGGWAGGGGGGAHSRGAASPANETG
jgi:hypothetical protein